MKNKSKNRMTGNCKKTQQASNQDLPLQNHDLHDQSIKDQAEPDPELLIDTEPELSSQMEFEKVLSQSKNKYVTHDNILYRYYFEVGRYPLLTAEEEKEYGLAAKSGDFEAWSRLFKGNLRLVIMIAQRYQNQGVELQDLISEGNLGVMHAVRKFEPEKGFRFSTYAVWWIRHYLSNAIMNNGRTIRIPIHVNKAIARLLAVQKSLSQQLKRKPTVKELAMETGQTISEVMHLMTNHESTLSLDAALGTDQGGGDFYHIVSDTEVNDAPKVLMGSEKFMILQSVLDHLDPQERKVIEYRFGINGKSKKTLEQTGEILGITRDQVRYSQMKALEGLKKIFEMKGILLQDILKG